MKCIKCGIFFSPTDIIEFPIGQEPICDTCCIDDSYYLIESCQTTWVVKGESFTSALEKWEDLNASISFNLNKDLRIKKIDVFIEA